MKDDLIGWDTETVDGLARLLCATRRNPLYVDGRVGQTETFIKICTWLQDVYKRVVCVGFNVAYDIRAILGYLPRYLLVWLARFGIVRFRYQRDIWAIKHFRSYAVIRCKSRHINLIMIDVYPYYGCSLRKAALKIGAEKGSQDVTDPVYVRKAIEQKNIKFREYCQRDADLALALWRYMTDRLIDAGVGPAVLSSPVSPATVSARHFFRAIPKQYRRGLPELNRMGRLVYHGGRIECLRRGYFPQAWQYDIRSAYPSILAILPHPGDVYWKPCKQHVAPSAVLGVYQVELRVDKRLRAGPVPVSMDGMLVYPVGCYTAWVDLYSLRLLRNIKGVTIRVLGGFEAFPLRPTPRLFFPDIQKMYDLKRCDKNAYFAAKLLLNSLSGKLAQRNYVTKYASSTNPAAVYDPDCRCWYVTHERPGPYQHMIYAAHVTGAIRTRLWTDTVPYLDDIICYSTDGFWSRRPIPLSCNEELGSWSNPQHNVELIVINNGCYSYRDAAGTVITRSRGFRSRDLHDHGYWHILKQHPLDAKALAVPCRAPMTLRAGLRTGKINSFDVMIKTESLVDYKRLWEKSPVTVGDLLDRSINSVPLIWYD